MPFEYYEFPANPHRMLFAIYSVLALECSSNVVGIVVGIFRIAVIKFRMHFECYMSAV